MKGECQAFLYDKIVAQERQNKLMERKESLHIGETCTGYTNLHDSLQQVKVIDTFARSWEN